MAKMMFIVVIVFVALGSAFAQKKSKESMSNFYLFGCYVFIMMFCFSVCWFCEPGTGGGDNGRQKDQGRWISSHGMS